MAHSLEAVSLDKLKSFLECSICLETLQDPRTLPCFHSYCLPCLDKFVKKKRNVETYIRFSHRGDRLNCPECRRPFSLKAEEKVADMIPNHFVVSMLEAVSHDQHRVKGIPCSHDCEASSVARCVDCDAFLCETCLSIHNKYKGHKSHSVLSMDELSKPENWGKVRGKLYCQQHKSKKLKFFCETCQQLICRYCTDFDHEKPSHKWLPIETVALKEKQELNGIISKLDARLAEVKITRQEITTAQTSLDESREKAMRAIRRRKDELLEQLTMEINKKTKNLMAEYNASYKAEKNALLHHEKETKTNLEQLESCKNLAMIFLEKATDEDIVSSIGGIRTNCDKLFDDFAQESLSIIDIPKYECDHQVAGLDLISCVKHMGCIKTTQIRLRGYSKRVPTGKLVLSVNNYRNDNYVALRMAQEGFGPCDK